LVDHPLGIQVHR